MKIITSLFLLFAFFLVSAQEKYTISGYVKDKQTGESLISANVFAFIVIAHSTFISHGDSISTYFSISVALIIRLSIDAFK